MDQLPKIKSRIHWYQLKSAVQEVRHPIDQISVAVHCPQTLHLARLAMGIIAHPHLIEPEVDNLLVQTQVPPYLILEGYL